MSDTICNVGDIWSRRDKKLNKYFRVIRWKMQLKEEVDGGGGL